MWMVKTFEAATSPRSASMTALDTSSDKANSDKASSDVGKPIDAALGARFHIFVIDTGWNSVASRVVREHLHMIRDLNIDEEVYVLDRATSIALLRYYPLQVGRDPIIAVHDLRPHHRHRIKHTHGFRMHLGILDSEAQVLGALKMFSRFMVTHRNAADIDSLVRQDLHRQGLAGAIEIIGGHEHQKMIE